jgi:hypothetical protein
MFKRYSKSGGETSSFRLFPSPSARGGETVVFRHAQRGSLCNEESGSFAHLVTRTVAIIARSPNGKSLNPGRKQVRIYFRLPCLSLLSDGGIRFRE